MRAIYTPTDKSINDDAMMFHWAYFDEKTGRRGQAGWYTVEIDHSDYVRNSFGTINGGVLGAVFQAAAEAARPGQVATDLQIHYLSQVQTGPARTSGTVSRDAFGHSIVSLRAVDAGHGDQLLDLATITLQDPPSA